MAYRTWAFLSGIVDPSDRVRPGSYPGAFRELLGLRITEFAPYVDGQANEIETDDGRRFGATLWSDVIEVSGAEVLARFTDDFFAGQPALTVNRVGRGSAYYIGTKPDQDGLAWLLDRACRAAGVSPAGGAERPVSGPGLEMVERRADGERWLFVLNYAGHAARMPIDSPALDLLTGTRFDGVVTVNACDLVILRMTA